MNHFESTNQPRVLIVDDQPANIAALSKFLKEEYHIQVANNGLKALKIAAGNNPPQLILLDIEMPNMNGYDVLRLLKSNSNTNSIAVIFVTARSRVEDEAKGFRLGAVDYISKPFHPAIVRARVRNHISLKIRTDLLEKLSNQDSLLEIPNRRRFEETLTREWSWTKRHQQSLSIVMMDIDHFKQYNDHFGHGAGDDCLRHVARILKNGLPRSTDLVARFGGEEFVALLPGTDATGAQFVAEQLRANVQASGLPHPYSETAPVVTMSVGVATHDGRAADCDAHQLLKRADDALYKAKEEGRNQVRIG